MHEQPRLWSRKLVKIDMELLAEAKVPMILHGIILLFKRSNVGLEIESLSNSLISDDENSSLMMGFKEQEGALGQS